MAEAYTVNDRTNQLVLDISSRMHGAKPPGDNGCSIAAIFSYMCITSATGGACPIRVSSCLYSYS